jgi:hypothetical protein
LSIGHLQREVVDDQVSLATARIFGDDALDAVAVEVLPRDSGVLALEVALEGTRCRRLHGHGEVPLAEVRPRVAEVRPEGHCRSTPTGDCDVIDAEPRYADHQNGRPV